MTTSFRDQVAIITGASSGIGWALARGLAAEGCKVGLLARRQDRLRELVEAIQGNAGTAACAAADITDRSATLAAIHKVQHELGPVNLLIANAGVGIPTLLDPVNIADVEATFRVNFFGVIHAIEAVLPGMLARGRGHIAAVSSLAGYHGLPGESAYCASKAAVNVYLDGLRIQLRSRGVRVTTICPGFVRTPMTEINTVAMPFVMEADEAARRIIRALQRRRKVFNFPWQTTFLTKLLRFLPDWVIARSLDDYNANPPMPSRASPPSDPPSA